MLKTGGGRLTPSPPPSPGHDSAAEWLKTMMSTSVDGNEAIYDDDVIVIKPHKDLEPPSNEQILVESPTIIEKLPSNEQILVESPTIIEKIAAKEDFFDNSTPHSSLKRPISTPLKKLAKKQKIIEPDFRPEIHKKKLSVIDELHKLEMEKIKKSIERDEALHEQKMRHNEEKHKLKLIKIQLEIEKLKKNLKVISF
ncbi:uncharacterized protein LOC120635086 isoform X1 [Pararge aegeria]|uniref:uncharacterized protein LOC120635086 isoform X1 n=1 Tax=Pararge aegeria TaxID=116150 RepID=UPI0019D01F6B|nr:uncharacterized protein LOC120635086 isoform X1 [Pararge aegeria]